MDNINPKLKAKFDLIAPLFTVALIAFYVFALIVHYQTVTPTGILTAGDPGIVVSHQPEVNTQSGDSSKSHCVYVPYVLDLTASGALPVGEMPRENSVSPIAFEIDQLHSYSLFAQRSRDPPVTASII